MERFNDIDEITTLVQKVTLGVDLLEVAKCYCEHNYDKSDELPVLVSVLEIILDVQKEVADRVDNLLVG